MNPAALQHPQACLLPCGSALTCAMGLMCAMGLRWPERFHLKLSRMSFASTKSIAHFVRSYRCRYEFAARLCLVVRRAACPGMARRGLGALQQCFHGTAH